MSWQIGHMSKKIPYMARFCRVGLQHQLADIIVRDYWRISPPKEIGKIWRKGLLGDVLNAKINLQEIKRPNEIGNFFLRGVCVCVWERERERERERGKERKVESKSALGEFFFWKSWNLMFKNKKSGSSRSRFFVSIFDNLFHYNPKNLIYLVNWIMLLVFMYNIA